MGRINRLHHIGMSVPSLDEARAFYVGLLGFTELGAGDFDRDPEVDTIMGLKGAVGTAAFLQNSDCMLELFEFAAPEQLEAQDKRRPVNLHGITHICLDVTDVLGLQARLKGAGMDFHSDPVDKAGVRTCYGRDPFGNVIELQEIVEADPLTGEPK